MASLITEPAEHYNEFRAVYTRPAAAYESAEDRERGYVTLRTGWFKSPVEAERAAIRNPEEFRATLVGLEMSWVTRSHAEPLFSEPSEDGN